MKRLFNDGATQNFLPGLIKIYRLINSNPHYDLVAQFLAENLIKNSKLSSKNISDLRKMLYLIRNSSDEKTTEIKSAEAFNEDLLPSEIKFIRAKLTLLNVTPETRNTLGLSFIYSNQKPGEALPFPIDIPISIQHIMLFYLNDQDIEDKKIINHYSSILPANLSTQDRKTINKKIEDLQKLVTQLTTFQEESNSWKRTITLSKNQIITLIFSLILLVLIIKLFNYSDQLDSRAVQEHKAFIEREPWQRCAEEKYIITGKKCIQPSNLTAIFQACQELCHQYNYLDKAAGAPAMSLGVLLMFVLACCFGNFIDDFGQPPPSIPEPLLNAVAEFYPNHLQEASPMARNLTTPDLIVGDMRQKITFLSGFLTTQEPNPPFNSLNQHDDDDDVGYPSDPPTHRNQYTLLSSLRASPSRVHSSRPGLFSNF